MGLCLEGSPPDRLALAEHRRTYGSKAISILVGSNYERHNLDELQRALAIEGERIQFRSRMFYRASLLS